MKNVIALMPSRLGLSGRFARSVVIMFAATMLGQIASVLFSPSLTRVDSPHEFGYLSVYMSVTGVLSVLAALGFEMAIPIASSDEEAANLVAVSGLSVAITTIILTAVALLWIGWTA